MAESLAARVARGTALAAGAASLVAAAVTLFVADRLVVGQEEQRLREIAAIALREFSSTEDLPSQIEDEVAELAPESIRIAVYRDDRFVGGADSLPNIPADTCIMHENTRACASTTGALRVVAGAARAPRSTTTALVSSAIAILVAAIAAAFIGRRTTRWALGPLHSLRDSLSTIRDDPGHATLARDDSVAEVAELRSALEELLARLGDALDGARRFSADAAHELKTPLTAIRAELELLAEEELAPPAAAAVERLRTRVVVLTRLVDRLLALTKASTRARLEVETIAVEDIVRDVVGRLSEDARGRVHIEADAPGMVNGDELLLAALLENAIENALKFSGNEDVGVHIAERDGTVVLDVTDRGPGLAPEDRARAFEPFFRAPSSRANAPGHGVGLAIVAQVAQAHAGTAAFVDPDAHGARLRVTLPAWSPTAE